MNWQKKKKKKKNCKEVEILGIKLDRSVNFHTHSKSICRKGGQKLRALLENFVIQVNYKISV